MRAPGRRFLQPPPRSASPKGSPPHGPRGDCEKSGGAWGTVVTGGRQPVWGPAGRPGLRWAPRTQLQVGTWCSGGCAPVGTALTVIARAGVQIRARASQGGERRPRRGWAARAGRGFTRWRERRRLWEGPEDQSLRAAGEVACRSQRHSDSGGTGPGRASGCRGRGPRAGLPPAGAAGPCLPPAPCAPASPAPGAGATLRFCFPSEDRGDRRSPGAAALTGVHGGPRALALAETAWAAPGGRGRRPALGDLPRLSSRGKNPRFIPSRQSPSSSARVRGVTLG